MAKIRAILVGIGAYGRGWAEDCRRHSEVDLVGFVAHSPRSRERALRDWNVPEDRLFVDLEKALGTARPDLVIDVTPPAAHCEIATAAFAAGADVLGQKPLSDNLEAAIEMVQAGIAAGCRHMISQEQRFSPQHRVTKALLQGGEIGEPEQVDVALYVPWADSPGTHYVTDPYMFLTDMGCHHFDAMRYVLGADPLTAQALSWNPSWAWHRGDASHVALFEFDACRTIHRATGCSNGQATPWNGNWRIEGPRGSITWQNGEGVICRDHRTEAQVRRSVDLSGWNESVGRIAVLEEFLAACREDRETECSGRDNLQTMRMTFAAVESARSGERVALAALAGSPGEILGR